MKKKIFLFSTLFLWLTVIILGGRYILRDRKEQYKDPKNYESILGENGKYKDNLVKYNDIFPDSLGNVSEVEEFLYLYYNPWDPNYLGYLVCSYSEEQFEQEILRLKNIESTEYKGIYGIEGFPYELCAVYADEYYGVIYALTDEQQNKIVYVSLEFCNYFSDIDYEKKIDKQYLPIGFDAKPGNDTRKIFDEKFNSTNN